MIQTLNLSVPSGIHCSQNKDPRIVPPANIKIFPNQHNVTKIKVDSIFADSVEWKQAKLKEIHVNSHSGYSHIPDEVMGRILTGQDELEVFEKCGPVNESIFNLTGNDLKSLENLKISVTVRESFELSKLRKLKNLDLCIHLSKEDSSEDVNSFVCLLENDSLEKLELESSDICLTELTMKQIGLNFPQLKKLMITSKSSINNINVILRHFNKLETLHWCSNNFKDYYKFQTLN